MPLWLSSIRPSDLRWRLLSFQKRGMHASCHLSAAAAARRSAAAAHFFLCLRQS